MNKLVRRSIVSPLGADVEDSVSHARWFELDYYLADKELVYISTYIERKAAETPYLILTRPTEITVVEYIRRLLYLKSNLDFSTRLVASTELGNARVSEVILREVGVHLTCEVDTLTHSFSELYTRVIPLISAHRKVCQATNRGLYCSRISGVPGKRTKDAEELLSIYFDLVLK